MATPDALKPFEDVIKAEYRAATEAKRRKGEIPRDRFPAGAMHLASNHIKSLFNTDPKIKNRVRTFVIHGYNPPCSTSTQELSLIKIAQLKLETHHTGTFLMVRVVTAPIRVGPVVFLVEDDDKDVAWICLQQQEPENIRPAEDVVSEGDILLIKQPFFKYMSSFQYEIRLDHLSDMETLGESDERIPASWQRKITNLDVSADDLKKEGNDLVHQKKFGKAIEKYSYALARSIDAEERQIILRNRALANLKLRRFDAALVDVGFSDAIRGDVLLPSEKAFFRAAEALYHLERYDESVQVLQALCKEFPENQQASKTLERAQLRRHEKLTGAYDFKRMQQEARTFEPSLLDYATYLGPVEVRLASDSKGRGLFLTQAVKAGDLLICEKAFGYASTGKSGRGNASHSLLMNARQVPYGLQQGVWVDLLRLVVQKTSNNPSQFAEFRKLCRGDWKAKVDLPVGPELVVDTFLIQQILAINAFRCPLVSNLEDLKSMSNSADKDSAYGIYLKASYINHECLGNATKTWIGDMLIVRAARDMDAGTEIVNAYEVASLDGSVERKDKMLKWGFQCECTYCKDARETDKSVIEKRSNLKNKIAKLQHGRQISVPAKVEPLIAALEATYNRPAHEVPRLLSLEAQFTVAQTHFGMRNNTRALASFVKTLEYLEFIVSGWNERPRAFAIDRWGYPSNHAPVCFVIMQSIYQGRGEGRKASQAREYARTAYRIAVGEDATFEQYLKDIGL